MSFKNAALVFSSLMLTACGVPTPGPFYDTPPLAREAPGAVISSEPFTPTVKGAAAYRVLYNSTDINGRTIAVSGVVYVPLAPPPPGGRNIVAWAHPTTGVAPGCAPSVDTGRFLGLSMADSIPGLSDFIQAGDIVAATDYEGMGAPGIHPYLVGVSEGRDVIDSVRAARALPGAQASGRFVTWGHSQGGQAALFAGQIAASYAPELKLMGVAAAAPPSDLDGEFAEPFSGDSGRMLGAYVYYSMSKTYNIPITTVVDPRAVPEVERAVTKCISTLPQGIEAVRAGAALKPIFLSHKPNETPPWPALFEENSPGEMPPGAPLLVVQGAKDTTVEPHWNESFAAKICARHETIEFVEFKGVQHLLIGYKSAPMVAAWIAGRFAGQKPPDNCKI